MKKKPLGLVLTAALGLALSTGANATLIDRGNGMICENADGITKTIWMPGTECILGSITILRTPYE